MDVGTALIALIIGLIVGAVGCYFGLTYYQNAQGSNRKLLAEEEARKIVERANEQAQSTVREADDKSRKVLEEKQWKAVENKIADVMTSYEKSIVKSEYDKEMSKVDWKKMEDKLRLAYDRIEWSKVNEELNKAVAEIKIDSLQQAYSQAMVELSSIQQQLCDNNLTGIPDTDVSLKAVEQGKKDIQKAINSLIRAKVKKVVHL